MKLMSIKNAYKMIGDITQLHRSLFEGMITEGYTEVQSFDFATQYIY